MTAPRFARIRPADLTEPQAALYRSITGGKRASTGKRPGNDAEGSLGGPFNAMLRQPRLGSALEQLGSTIRYETDLSDRCREMAILVVAAHWSSAYEQYAHEPIARRAGVDELAITAIREQSPLTLEDRTEQVVVDTARALVHDGDLTDEQYATALDVLGESGVFEILTLVGYYTTLALQMRVLRVSPPAAE